MKETIKGQSSFTVKFLKVKRRIQGVMNAIIIKKIKNKKSECNIFATLYMP